MKGGLCPGKRERAFRVGRMQSGKTTLAAYFYLVLGVTEVCSVIVIIRGIHGTSA